MKIVLVLSLVQGILAGSVSESTLAEAVCDGGWKVIGMAHVVGGMAQPNISDISGCKAQCVVDDCTAIDWNLSEVPYEGSRCWIHTSTYEPMQVLQNERVFHFMKCANEENLPTMEDVNYAACNNQAQPAVLTTAPFGMISYPVSGLYSRYAACSWLISGPVGTVITIHFTRFDVEDYYDKLLVYDGDSAGRQLLATLTGTGMQSDVTSSGNVLFLRFLSDDSVQYSGYELTYSTST